MTVMEWCELPDYEVRGRPLNEEEEEVIPIKKHKHLNRHQVQFEDGTVIGVLVPPDEGHNRED